MASTVAAPHSLPALQTDHRKLLNPDRPDDSPITDQEDIFDNDVQSLDDASAIGVSISHAQTYMKSPETPAFEKQRALDRSLGYFDPQFAASAIPEGPEQTTSTPDHAQERPTQPFPPLPTPWKVHPPAPPHRSSIADALNEAKNVTKRRSLSGSNMLESLKKMLPDMPSLQTLKSQPFYSSFTNDTSQGNYKRQQTESTQRPEIRSKPLFSHIAGLDGSDSPEANSSAKISRQDTHEAEGGLRNELPRLETVATSNSGRSKRHSDPPVPLSALHNQPSGLDGNVKSLLSPTIPGRRNSESSLYMSRRLSGISAFDDTDAWAHITGMANSRFKAITDSFQSSTLRFPRLPNVRTNFGKSTPPSDDETMRNTQLNSQTSSRARASSKEREKLYTNMHHIRKSKKLIEIEASQNRAHPVLSSAFDELEGDLIVMGGYRGSILREAKPPNRQLWAPVKVGLNLRKADLEVGLTREDEERASETIVPSGVLSHIGPIDICRRLLKHARKCPNVKEGKLRVHDWGYDWRLSPDLLAGRFIEYLESLECNQPSTPPERRGVWLIAHSLGGLITRYVVNLRPELFAGVLYAGTPMNCVNILGPLRNGDDVLLSSKVLTAQVTFTIRTSYALLPEDGRCFINKETNERYDLNFFDPQTWEDWHLSPCIRPAIDPTVAAKERDRSKSLVGIMAQSVTNLSRPGFLSSGSDSSRVNTLASKPSQALSQSSLGKADSNPELVNKGPSSREAADQLDASNAASTIPAAETSARSTAQAYAGNLVTEPIGETAVEPTMSKSQSLRPSVATACTLDPIAAREYLARTLADVLAFKRALRHKPELQDANRYPPHALIFGKTVPTVYGAKVVSREAIKYTDCFEDLAFAAGDGVVLASAAQMPDGYRVVKGGRIESDRGHVGLMGDLEGVGAAMKALVEGRRRGVGMGCFGAQ